MRRVLLAIALLSSACAMPSQAARTRDTRPALAVAGAPAGSRLLVDGLDVGDAATYDGQLNVLRLEPGSHVIVIRDAAGNVVFQQRIFLESELKTVEVH